MEFVSKIDPEALGEAYDRAQTDTGGGGGGGKRQKEKHQGKKTQNALREELIKARIRNTTLFELKHPEQQEELNTDIDVTLRRVFEIDEDVVGVPSTRDYIQWVYRRLNTNDKPPIEKECELDFETSSGPGGQNVNKVSTAVRMVHLLTGIRFKQEGDRTQEGNRADADERMETLIDQHLEKWSELVVSGEGEMRRIMVRKLREVLRDLVLGDKRDYFDDFCRMMGRYPKDHIFDH